MTTKDWKLPVAIDRDGAVAALYCGRRLPEHVLLRDGEITGVKLGVLSAAQLKAGHRQGTGATS